MALGAYCFLSGCTVFCSDPAQYGGAQWVVGPQPGMQYGIVQFVSQFPGSGWTVPGYCLPPPPPPSPPGSGTPPPPVAPPPPAPNPTTPPIEVPPPSPPASGVYTGPGEDGPPHDTQPPGTTVPPQPCGTPMPILPGSGLQTVSDGKGSGSFGQFGANGGFSGQYGFEHEEHLQTPHIGMLTPLNLFNSATPDHQKDGRTAKNRPIFTTQARIDKDKDGSLKVYHNATGPGYLVFHSPDLKNWGHLWGSEIDKWKVRFPTKISSSTFLIHSGEREDGSLGDSPNQKLAFGLPHKTSQYPKMGFVFERTSGPVLKLHGTDVNGALDISCNPVFAIRTGLNVLCGATFQSNVTVDGNLTVIGNIINSNLDTWTTITANTVDASPYSAALIDDFSAEGAYTIITEVVAYDQIAGKSIHQNFRHGFTNPGGTNDMVSVGVMDDSIMDEAGTVGTGVSYTTDGIGTVTAQIIGPESDVCWSIRYRILFQGVC